MLTLLKRIDWRSMQKHCWCWGGVVSQGDWYLLWISFFSEFLGVLKQDGVWSLLKDEVLKTTCKAYQTSVVTFLKLTPFQPHCLTSCYSDTPSFLQPSSSALGSLGLYCFSPSIHLATSFSSLSLVPMYLLHKFYPNLHIKYSKLPGFYLCCPFSLSYISSPFNLYIMLCCYLFPHYCVLKKATGAEISFFFFFVFHWCTLS